MIYIPKLVQPLHPMQLRGAGPLPSRPDSPTDSHLATNIYQLFPPGRFVHQMFVEPVMANGHWVKHFEFTNAKIYPRKSTVNAKAPPSLQRKVSLHLCSHGAATSATQDSPCTLKLDDTRKYTLTNQVLLVCAYFNLFLPSFCPQKLHRT